MDMDGTYILRICCCAVIGGAIITIGGKGPESKVRRMIVGLFIAFSVISPLREIHLNDLWSLPDVLYEEGEQITAAAQADTKDEISDIIIERTQAYILDEANSLDAQIQVTMIRLDPDTLEPVQVELTGNISPYARSVLSDSIECSLGIGKGDQLWNK